MRAMFSWEPECGAAHINPNDDNLYLYVCIRIPCVFASYALSCSAFDLLLFISWLTHTLATICHVQFYQRLYDIIIIHSKSIHFGRSIFSHFCVGLCVSHGRPTARPQRTTSMVRMYTVPIHKRKILAFQKGRSECAVIINGIVMPELISQSRIFYPVSRCVKQNIL